MLKNNKFFVLHLIIKFYKQFFKTAQFFIKEIVYYSGRSWEGMVYRMVSEALKISPSFGAGAFGNAENVAIDPSNPIGKARIANNMLFYWNSARQATKELTGKTLDGTRELVFRNTGEEVIQYSFLGGTFAEKFINKHCSAETASAIKGLDKNLLDTKFGQNAIEKIFDCKLEKAADTGKFALKATEETLKTKAGRIAADTLGTTTKLGLVASGLSEAPNLYHAYKNGDFGKQTVRSTATVAASSVAFGIVSNLAKTLVPSKYKTLAMVGGAIVGSMMASKTTDALLDKVMGKSIQKQKREAAAKLAEMKLNRAQV